MSGWESADDVFGAEELADVALRMAQRYVTAIQEQEGLPEGVTANQAVRYQALAMLRSAATVIASAEEDADDDDA